MYEPHKAHNQDEGPLRHEQIHRQDAVQKPLWAECEANLHCVAQLLPEVGPCEWALNSRREGNCIPLR
jgi:hypothetical protein